MWGLSLCVQTPGFRLLECAHGPGVPASSLPDVGLKATSTKQLIEIMEMSSPDNLKKMTDAGLKFYRPHLEKSEVMWVPTGWLLFKKVANSALLYGVRKSMFRLEGRLRALRGSSRPLP